MSDELRARAIRMQLLLDDADIQAGFADMEADIMDAWKRCHDPAERENLWRAVDGLARLQTWMRSAASYDLTALRRIK